VQAFGGAPDGQAALVALFSVASAAGRLAAGHLPERALASRRTPRCAPAHCKTFSLWQCGARRVYSGWHAAYIAGSRPTTNASGACEASNALQVMHFHVLGYPTFVEGSVRLIVVLRMHACPRDRRCRRPCFLVAAAALTGAAMALAAFADLRALWLVAPLTGFAYGAARARRHPGRA